MLEGPSLAAALARRAAADPESPFLFWTHGWHWSWWSWRHTADLVARWAAELAGLPAGTRVGFAGDVFPQAIALDLAVQAAGLTPVPLAAVPWPGGEAMGAALRELGCPAWVEATVEGDLRVTALEAAGGARAGGGGTLLVRDAVGGEWREVAAAVAAAAAARVGAAVVGEAAGAAAVDGAPGIAAVGEMTGAARVGAARGERKGKPEITVLGRPLGDAAGRVMAAWAVTAGAAVALEADPGQRLAAAAWARPTVFAGSRVEVLGLAARLGLTAGGRQGGWWRRLARRGPGDGGAGRRRRPGGRLRVVLQEEVPEAAEIELWGRSGVRLVPLPGLEGGWREEAAGPGQ